MDKYIIECLIVKDQHDLLKVSNCRPLDRNEAGVSIIKYVGYDVIRSTDKLHWTSITAWGQEMKNSILISNVITINKKI